MTLDAIAREVEARAKALTTAPIERKPQDPRFVAKCLHANERGDGLLFAAIHRHSFRYNMTVIDTKKEAPWYVWNGIIWEKDYNRRAMAACEDVALEYESQALAIREEIKEKGIDKDDKQHKEHYLHSRAKKYEDRADRLRGISGVNKCLEWAPIVCTEIAVKESDFDKKPWLLPCGNGVINLKTRVLETGRPEDLLTRAIKTNYYPHSPAPIWRAFIPEISDSEEVAAFIKRSFGYALTGHSREQYIWVFIGNGRNGKGVMFDLIADIMGPYYHEINRGMILEQRSEPSPAAASEHKHSLHCKRLITAVETNKGQKIDGGAVKGLTGENVINCRPNFKSEVIFWPTHTLMLQTNNMPTGLTKEFSLVERLLIIDFPFSYVEDIKLKSKQNPPRAHLFRQKDPELKEKLRHEKEGILAWLVEGCGEWQEHGIAPPSSISEAVSALSREEDYVGQFIEDALTIHTTQEYKNVSIPSTRMYEAFRWWWHVNQDSSERRIPAMKTINASLRERGYDIEKKGGIFKMFSTLINTEIEGDVDAFIKKAGLKS